jgi:hypothetical protein
MPPAMFLAIYIDIYISIEFVFTNGAWMCDPQMVSDEVMQAVIAGFFSCELP